MSLESKLDRPKSLTDLAVERIRAAIVEDRLAFGEQLSEAALAVNLGISKTPVREALLRLKMDGLVEIQPQRGTFVFTLDADEVEELTAFREIIETEALGLGDAPRPGGSGRGAEGESRPDAKGKGLRSAPNPRPRHRVSRGDRERLR